MGSCRLCLTDFQSLDHTSIQSMLDKIRTVFSFEVTAYPGLSEVICPDCSDTVSKFYEYFCMVHQNQLQLYCQIENVAVKIEPPTSPYSNSRHSECQTENNHLTVNTDIQNEPHEVNLDEQNLPESMEVAEASQEKEECFIPEDAIKIEPVELSHIDNSNDKTSKSSWIFAQNKIFRQLEMLCDVCNEDQFSYKNLEEHLRNEHARDCNIICCGKKLFFEKIMTNHFEKHEFIFKTLDFTTVKRGNALDSTLQVEKPTFPVSENQSDLAVPTSMAVSTTSRDKHWKIEFNQIYLYLAMECDICFEDQLTYHNLKQHLKDVHGRLVYLTCCATILYEEQDIAKHLNVHCPFILSTRQTETLTYSPKNYVFASILEDFKLDLDKYKHSIPNMELALKDHIIEKRKLFNTVDYLVEKYFPLNCELCDKKLDRLYVRRKHFKQSHHNEKYFVSCCGTYFTDRYSSMRHLNLHWKRKGSENTNTVISKPQDPSQLERVTTLLQEFREELIEAGFKPLPSAAEENSADQLRNIDRMQDYLIAKHYPLSLDCDLCGAKLSTYPERRDHFRDSHPKTRLYVECCGVKIFKRYRIILHLKHHNKQGHSSSSRDVRELLEHPIKDNDIIESYFNMNCNYCDYEGTSFPMLRHHARDEHKYQKFYITCCQKKLFGKTDLLDHIACHQNPSFMCEYCEEKFTTKKSRAAHINSTHPKESSLKNLFQCTECLKILATEKILKNHMHKHSRAQCEICKLEVDHNALQSHMESVHRMGEAIICPECHKIFYSKAVYISHRVTLHKTTKL